jgi:ABC-type transport system involved in cytochrome c biogenesis permease component
VSGAALLWHQYRYDQKQFWREPATVFFTVALPLIFLFIFVSIFGNQTNEVNGHPVKGSTYYVPGILALAMVSATIVNLAITFTILREKGLLKRVRSTPLPPWVYLAGRVLTAIVVTLLLVALLQNAEKRSEEAINLKLDALAVGIADLMRAHTGDDQDLHDNIERLTEAVGVEERVSSGHSRTADESR